MMSDIRLFEDPHVPAHIRSELARQLAENASTMKDDTEPNDTIVRRWEAKFPGKCDICDGPIRRGDVIGLTVDGRYVCGSNNTNSDPP